MPHPSALGNLGRNALTGPGFYNFDVALGRGFRLPRLGESTCKLRFRADAFNVFSHANLGNPDTVLSKLNLRTSPSMDASGRFEWVPRGDPA